MLPIDKLDGCDEHYCNDFIVGENIAYAHNTRERDQKMRIIPKITDISPWWLPQSDTFNKDFFSNIR